jgi:hypothetical protein
MDLIVLVLVVCLIGFLVWLLTTYIPMPPEWARAIQVIALIIVVLYLITRLFNLPNVLGK